MAHHGRLTTEFAAATGFLLFTGAMSAATIGSVFVSGHDPDFHASQGPNPVGAQHLIQDALSFARNGNSAPILLLESNLSNEALGDHTDSEVGLMDSGFTAGSTSGNHYVKVNFGQFATIDLSQFSAIFIPSDHGGTLTGNDLQTLDARSADILAYLNSGGGLVAWAQDGDHQPPTSGPAPKLFGFLPFLVSTTAFSEAENGNTLTSFGTSLGLTNGDINGNFSHNVFTATGGMTVVDRDAAGDILSLGFRGEITPVGVAPEPSSGMLISIGFVVLLVGCAFRNRKVLKSRSN